ncbi:TonB-dependent receptor plug domain-containing protein [Eilatimonas milleporae]|uniref:Iron complex outermembrane receptor protein n=1 Tax=Eilatimonas milleporae TaxID=911205 RepID=A0A3M0CTC9_9PROT|nr:TonB-dependent receptor [Eilatimonas milleporae]RMB12287.1 iron complex outermembrane receptor protein [Eilatimonas milleporae]
MPFGKTIAAGLLLSSASLLALAPASAQGAAADSGAGADDMVEQIIVTGTRRAERTAFSSLAPIDIITSDAVDRTASEDLLDTLAQIVPSFNVQRLPLADGLVFVRPATLRGLSPDQTLVLVNGKRRHRAALLGSNGAQSADLAQIPSFAIERIEVLRDGASAQYGSDAIAGVINILLDDEPGHSAFGQFSEYYEGDGDNYRAGFQAGFGFAERGFLVTTFEYFDAARTSRTRQRPDALAFQAANPDLDVPNPVQNWGQPERDGIRFALNSQYALADTTDAYLFGTYGESDGVSDFNWRNPDTTSAFNPSDAFPGFDLRTLYPAGFTPQFGQEDRDISLTGGARGALGDGAFTWDASLGYGSNRIEYVMTDTINASLGPDSPTAFRPGTLEQREFNINLDFVHTLDIGNDAGPVNIAFGGERREETYEIEAGDPASFAIGPGAVDGLPSGSNGFPGYSDAQAGTFDQESYAAYVDVEVPLTSRWTLGLAGRYEDFSEFGDTLNGKLSTRFEITPTLALRATASTGFRAPTPGQLFSERTSQGLDTVTLNIFTRGRFSPQGAVADIISRRADADINPLTAEESENYSLGLAYSNNAGFSASIDVYQVNVDDRFGTSQTFTLTDAERAELVALGVPGGEGITSVNFFQNDFDTRTRGVDIVAAYTTQAGPGTLSLTAAYNYNETEVTDGRLEDNETLRVRFEDLLPKHTGNAAANYAVGDLEFLGRLRYFGPWTDFSFNAAGEIFQEFGGEVFVDLAVTWNIREEVSLRVGAENVFDTFPDEAEFQSNRGLIYSRNAPYDTDGGLYYLRLGVDF